MKKLYLIPNMITAFGLACGLFVIFKVNMIEPGSGYYDVMTKSALLLLLAAFADFVDGTIARAFRAESQFGLMFDSLADSVTFGVAPSVLLLKSLSLQQGTVLSFLAATGAMVYSLCGVLRLVRYSVNALDSKKGVVEITSMKKNFTGLPIPAAAAAAISANLFFLSPFSAIFGNVDMTTRAIFLSCLMFVLGYLMVSRWKFPSLKVLHFRIPSFPLVFMTVLIAVFLLYGIFNYFPLILVIISWSYVILGMVLLFIRLLAGKKSKTLQDFEPDDVEYDIENSKDK